MLTILIVIMILVPLAQISLTSTNINAESNLNVSNGIDLTGNLIATGSVDLANNLIMDSNKIYWNDGGTYISGNTTSMTLDGDNSITMEATTSISLNTLTTSISGNLDVGSGIDLTGNLIATGYIDLNDTIQMNTSKKLYWADTSTSYITGTTSSVSIGATNSFSVTAASSSAFYTPQLYIYGTYGNSNNLDAELIIKSRGTYDGKSRLTMISDNGADKGDGIFRLKHLNGLLSLSTDHLQGGL